MRRKEVRIKAMLGRVEWATNLLNEIKPKGKVVGVEVGVWKSDLGTLCWRKIRDSVGSVSILILNMVGEKENSLNGTLSIIE